MAREKEYVSCSACGSSGKQKCERCNGTGKVRGRVEWNRYFTCSECGGSGKKSCWKCCGSGQVEEEVDD